MYDGRTPAHILWHTIFLYVFVSFISNKKYIRESPSDDVLNSNVYHCNYVHVLLFLPHRMQYNVMYGYLRGRGGTLTCL